MPIFPENMNPSVARKLLKVGDAFRIQGPFFSYEEIKMGNVNHTYKVNYIRDDGSGMAKIKSYLVQRVNTYAFQKPLELMANIDKVTEYIHAKYPHVKCLHFHHTAERNNYLMDEDGFLAAEQLCAVGDVQQLRESGNRAQRGSGVRGLSDDAVGIRRQLAVLHHPGLPQHPQAV